VTPRRAIVVVLVVAVLATTAIILTQHHHAAKDVTATHPRSSQKTHAPSPRNPPTRSRHLIAAAHWVHTPQGFRLIVRPSSHGREDANHEVGPALAQALKLGRPMPLTLTPAARQSLDNQLRCHADFAPDKPFWDLESWRPNVGFSATVLALCNP